MKYRVLFILFCISLPLGLLSGILRLVSPAQASAAGVGVLGTNHLSQPIQNSPENENIRFLLYFDEQVNLTAARAPGSDKVAQRSAVMHQLQATADSSQTAVLNQLEMLQQSGEVSSYRQLWIVNAIGVVGTEAALATLTNHPDVVRVEPDSTISAFTQSIDEFDVETFEVVAQPITTELKNWGLPHARVPEAWHGYGIDGAGVVVAIIDSGVDFTHPDLLPNYRGNLGGGSFDHNGSWFYAYDPTAVTVPTDTFGHGTHVAGTAVGHNGLGVAPGAEWIGVSIADSFGVLHDSSILAALQWVLAPDGDPTLAPDIVNGSWGDDANPDTFQPAIDALVAAGIVPIFSIGNSGPFPGTLGAPASYQNSIAVGAHDDSNDLVWFSSRGPSPFHNDPAPNLTAPGTAIFSSYPQGLYAIASGTSMAAPHVAGAAALLLSADPTLTQNEIVALLAETAVPLTSTHPNMGSGYGRLDVYDLLTEVMPTGTLAGQVTLGGAPLPNATVEIELATGYRLTAKTDGDGRYRLPLSPDSYTVHINHFGLQPYSSSPVLVSANSERTHNISLTRQPFGTLNGTLLSGEDGQPLTGVEIAINGVDGIATVTDEDGRYSIKFPEGQFKLTYDLLGYEYASYAIFSQPGQVEEHTLTLEKIPTVLLVDAGQWHFGSKIEYYQTSLHDINRSYDTHVIRNPFRDVPTGELLSQYDTVIWSDPARSPGIIGATDAITTYLEAGGNLVLSGQNIGILDSSLYGTFWWYQYLQANFIDKRVITQPIAGAADTPFSGFLLGLNGPGSARNQFGVDSAEPLPNSFASPIFFYANGDPAGLGIRQCQPYQLVYLGFGLEGVSFQVVRSSVINRIFAYLEEPDELVGSRWLNEDQFDFALPGETYSYTLTLQNLSEVYTDTFRLEVDKAEWPTAVSETAVTLGPCETTELVVSVSVPDGVAKDVHHEVTITAVSTVNPAGKQRLEIAHKTPGTVLLVDDDRWYQQEALYQRELVRNGIFPDIWDTSKKQNNSPTLEFLSQYDFVIWYTGFDWFKPITTGEREALEQYLAHGGRLFLSSQDFLYHHSQSSLASAYLGVVGYRESVSPTAMFGGGIPGFSIDLAGPLSLNYGEYDNYSDGLIPVDSGEVLFWHNGGMPAAVGHANEQYRSVFMSVPFEKLPAENRTEVMGHMLGWISDLGGSVLTVDGRSATPGQPRTYTITVQNGAMAPQNWVTVTNVLPPDLELDVGSLGGGATYEAASRTVSWAGFVESGQIHHIVYQATPSAGLGQGTAVENKATFAYARHPIQFDSYAAIWIDPPDLQSAHATLSSNQPLVADRITLTLWLTNSGVMATDGVTAVLYLPDRLYPLTHTLDAPFGTPFFDSERLIWEGDLAPGQSVTASLAFTRRVSARTQHIQTAVAVQDGVTAATMTPFEAFIYPYRAFFPIFSKEPDG